jgi:hypothetical protein
VDFVGLRSGRRRNGGDGDGGNGAAKKLLHNLLPSIIPPPSEGRAGRDICTGWSEYRTGSGACPSGLIPPAAKPQANLQIGEMVIVIVSE